MWADLLQAPAHYLMQVCWRIPWRIPCHTTSFLCTLARAPAHTLAHTPMHNLLSMYTLGRLGACRWWHIRWHTPWHSVARPGKGPGAYPGAYPGARLVIYADIGPTWYKPWRIPQLSLAETLAHTSLQSWPHAHFRGTGGARQILVHTSWHIPPKDRFFFTWPYIHIHPQVFVIL